MHWGESVCGGGELKAKRSLATLLPGSLLDPPSIATRQPAALGTSARQGPSLVPGASRARRVAGEGFERRPRGPLACFRGNKKEGTG